MSAELSERVTRDEGPVAVTDPLRVDACVHPYFRAADDIRGYMEEPWRSRVFPGPEQYDFVPLETPYCEPDGEAHAGSDPRVVRMRVCDRAGVDRAVLVPLTRGLLPTVELSHAVCAATNRWLVETWLDVDEGEAFLGTIRVDPRDPALAIAEIETWAGHPRMVQVAATTQSHAPYGDRRFLPLWEAVEHFGLPLLLHYDAGDGIEFPVTPAGRPRYLLERDALAPLNYAYHLANMMGEGVFDRFPGLRLVLADGGFEMLPALLWRMEHDRRPNRPDIPLMGSVCEDYIGRNVFFCADRLGLPPDPDVAASWLPLGKAGEALMFASRYPHRDVLEPSTMERLLPPPLRAPVLGGTAARLYGLAPEERN